VFVTPELCRSYNLRDGQWVKGQTRRGNRGAQLFRLTEINGGDPAKAQHLADLDELTVVSPTSASPRTHVYGVPVCCVVPRLISIILMCPLGNKESPPVVTLSLSFAVGERPPRQGKTSALFSS